MELIPKDYTKYITEATIEELTKLRVMVNTELFSRDENEAEKAWEAAIAPLREYLKENTMSITVTNDDSVSALDDYYEGVTEQTFNEVFKTPGAIDIKI